MMYDIKGNKDLKKIFLRLLCALKYVCTAKSLQHLFLHFIVFFTPYLPLLNWAMCHCLQKRISRVYAHNFDHYLCYLTYITTCTKERHTKSRAHNTWHLNASKHSYMDEYLLNILSSSCTRITNLYQYQFSYILKK